MVMMCGAILKSFAELTPHPSTARLVIGGVLAVVLVVAYLACAYRGAAIAAGRGRSEKKWTLYGAIPFVSYIHANILRSRARGRGDAVNP
jgi:hypothetical protein